MKNYQRQLKQLREKQKLTIEGVASKMGFSAQTIQMLEDTDDLFSLNLPTPSLKNYFRKYAECLQMPEKKIVSLLNRIDYLDYKRSRRGKLKAFDYFNRLMILILLAVLGYTAYQLYLEEKANALKQSVITLPSPINTSSSQDTTTGDTTTQSQQKTLDNNNTQDLADKGTTTQPTTDAQQLKQQAPIGLYPLKKPAETASHSS
ncbi:helix-turn-helix domain-containing protein [Facilibium subflavum]|uniref:helix-turn-helix domain-containing protein n=1 Tax=Facilibium subflavum TaxID=2219058 RepID=UPI0013C34194|nr:helix-turn-helix domain-containing protein [Facilibium subflavum]